MKCPQCHGRGEYYGNCGAHMPHTFYCERCHGTGAVSDAPLVPRPALPTDSQVIAAMARYGGSFAKGLAMAAKCADSENLRKIKNAWPEYWEQYEQFAMRDMQREGVKE